MKKGVEVTLIFIALIALLFLAIFVGTPTGKTIGGESGGPEFTGPTQTQISCMETCSGCTYGDASCFGRNSVRCGAECGVETSGPPKPADGGETCMQKCILVGCDEFDLTCQNSNGDGCEEECNMKGDAPNESDMDAEQLCISNCVAKEDPTVICGNSQEGETGGSLCQKCANECVHLYSGSCLDDAGVTEKENECISKCEHCYGGPVMGPSGQGWDCIVDVKCEDASSEFGDDAGTGDASYEEGHEGPGIVAEVFESIGNFFKGIFGGGE